MNVNTFQKDGNQFLCLNYLDKLSIKSKNPTNKAIKIIESELKKLYHPNPKGKNKDVEFPKVRISNWNDSSISLRAWVRGKDNTDTFENMYIMYYNVKKSFEKNNIEIPYPKVVTINKRKNSQRFFSFFL